MFGSVLLLYTAFNALAQPAGTTGPGGLAPFEVKLLNSDYALTYFVQTTITQNKVTITVSSGRMDERDSIVFKKTLEPSAALQQLGNTTLEGLKKNYANDCMEDGLQLTITVKRKNKRKSVHVANYYQENIAAVIDLVNTLVPDRYRTWYDKDKLVADYKRCKGMR